jgi:phenylacetic acid degradation operon negative regulatory protein
MSKNSKIQEKILESLMGKKAVSKEKLSLDNTKDKYAITRSLKGLAESGLIEEISTERSSFFRITPGGRQKLRNIKLSTPTSLVDTRWDGFWRMIILDLPETRKSERDSIRYILKKAGFVCMKNSVWISPYPFEHLFMNIKNDLGLHDEIMIIVTQSIDPTTEKSLLESFGLN